MLTPKRTLSAAALKSLFALAALSAATAVQADAQEFGLVFRTSDVQVNGETVIFPASDGLMGTYPSRTIVATCQNACESPSARGVFTDVGGKNMAAMTVVTWSGRPPAERRGHAFFRVEIGQDAIVLGSGPGGVVPRELARTPVALSLRGTCQDFKAGKAMFVLGDGNAAVRIPASTQLYYPVGIPGC